MADSCSWDVGTRQREAPWPGPPCASTFVTSTLVRLGDAWKIRGTFHATIEVFARTSVNRLGPGVGRRSRRLPVEIHWVVQAACLAADHVQGHESPTIQLHPLLFLVAPRKHTRAPNGVP